MGTHHSYFKEIIKYCNVMYIELRSEVDHDAVSIDQPERPLASFTCSFFPSRVLSLLKGPTHT